MYCENFVTPPLITHDLWRHNRGHVGPWNVSRGVWMHITFKWRHFRPWLVFLMLFPTSNNEPHAIFWPFNVIWGHPNSEVNPFQWPFTSLYAFFGVRYFPKCFYALMSNLRSILTQFHPKPKVLSFLERKWWGQRPNVTYADLINHDLRHGKRKIMIWLVLYRVLLVSRNIPVFESPR